MTLLLGRPRTTRTGHAVYMGPKRPWFSGMTARSLCGVRVDVREAALSGPLDTSLTCRRCAGMWPAEERG